MSAIPLNNEITIEVFPRLETQPSPKNNCLNNLILCIVLSILTIGFFPLIQFALCSRVKRVTINTKMDLLDCLKQSSKFLTEEKHKKILVKIQRFVHSNPIIFANHRDNHELHDMVTDITLHARNIPALQKIWGVFLDKMHLKQAQHPCGSVIKLDFSPEKLYLNDSKLQPGRVKVHKVEVSSKGLNKILKEIIEIELDSFSKFEAYSLSYFRGRLQKNDDMLLLIAQDEKSQHVEGYMMAQLEGSIWHICSIARRANAAKRGVARELFREFISNHMPVKAPIILECREGNAAAIKVYEEFGFKQNANKREGYYQFPNEAAIPMMRPAT